MKRTSIKKGIFTCIAVILGIASSFAQTITNVAVDASACTGRTVSVAFTPTGFTAGTEFTVQLSDASGAFTSPVEIGKGTVSPIVATIPPASAAGAGYKVRVISLTPAINGSTSSSILVKTTPNSPAGATYTYCVGAPPIVLGQSGGGTNFYINNGTILLQGDVIINTDYAVRHHVEYYVTQVVDGCESGAGQIIVGGYEVAKQLTITNPAAVCQNSEVPTTLLTNAINNYNIYGGEYTWYTDPSGGTGSPTIPTLSTSIAGETNYFVTTRRENSLNRCESPRAKITVSVKPAPSAPTVTNKTYTVGQKNIPALAATGTGSFYWFTQESGGVGVTAGPVPSTDKAGTTSYWVTQTVDNCESPRAKLDVVVSAGACTPPAGPVVQAYYAYCVGAVAGKLTAQGTGIKWYSGDGVTPLSEAPTPITTVAHNARNPSYFVSQTVNGCESERIPISIDVKATTPAPTVVAPAPICQNNIKIITSEILRQAIVSAGTNYQWYSTADGNPSTTVPSPSVTTPGSTDYYVTQTNTGSCESPRSKITIVITEAPAAPTVTNRTYTVGQTNIPPLSATGTGSFFWFTQAVDGVGSTTPPTPSAAVAGTTSYYVTQTVGVCESPRAKIDVIVTGGTCTPPPAPTSSSKTQFCVGDAPQQLSANGQNLKWYAYEGSIGHLLPGAPTPSTSSPATFLTGPTYYVTQTINGCESARLDFWIVVLNFTPTPIITDPAPICQNSVVTGSLLTGAINGYGGTTDYIWSETDNADVGSTTIPIPSTAVAGTEDYYVYRYPGHSCPSAKAKITVTVLPAPPIPTVVSPVNYIVRATNAVPLTATGTALKWYTTATGGTALTTAPTPITTTAGTTSYYVSQTLNGCEGPRAEIVVSVATCTTPVPTVTTPVTYNVGATAVALTATGTALKWYTVATGGTALAAAPTPSTTTIGTVSYYVSQTLNGCEGPRTKIDVVISACATAAPTVANVTYCLSETAVALTATGIALKWYTVATGGTGVAAAPIPATTTAGTKSYYVTQTLNGCESPRAKIDVIVNPPTAAPTVGSAVVYCFNETAIPLTATGTALKWYTAATGGTVLTTAPTPSTSAAGTTSYYVSQTLNTCESTRAKVDVTVKPAVPAPTIAAAAIEYCQSVKAIPLTATPSTGGELNWYGTNATGGTASATAPTPSTETEGTTSYYVNQKDADGCLSSRAKIDVKINVTPKPALATSFVEYCQGATASPLSATGTSLKWYLTLTDTNPRTSALTPFTEKVEDYSFYVTQTGANTCESQKAEIKVHIKPLPSATISGNNAVSPGQSTTITIEFTGDAPWQYTLSNGQTGTSSNAITQVTVTPQATTNYVVTRVSNACGVGLSNGVAVVTVLIPTITTGSPSVSQICAGRSFTVPFQKSGDFPTGNKFTAQISTVNDITKFVSIPSTDNGTILTATVPDTVKAGSYFIRVVSAGQGNTLPGSVSSVKMTINPLPVATITGPSNVLMGQSATLSIAITGDAPWTFNLNDGAKDTLISSSISPISVRISPKTTSVYQITSISNGCGVGRGAGTFRVQVDPVLGTEPPVVAADWLKIYPTMIENKCTVEITSAISAKEALFEIFDLNGRSLAKRSIRQKVTEVDFTSRPPGMYLLKVQNGDRTSVQRIFKP
ncbi:T9SS type A sorting domain-containing protein [Dyadobacter sp. CY345]|uniref:Ig-like domain-containing protein n=1 Tax=Dyadobacter sp. CY345 TaxID=2909335 RepID=UPI001F2EAC02|nr:T9SS type A sorting domain-containing protein [Dyadobacter sp. CY345]MCF2445392.1 T9SS type A sorting domain-containing protein [Dyadobacter sp. CY345]